MDDSSSSNHVSDDAPVNQPQPPTVAHDSQEPYNETSLLHRSTLDQSRPSQSKKRGGAVKKRKRALSYNKQKGSNNQKISRPRQPANSEDASSHAAADREETQPDNSAVSAPTPPDFKTATKQELEKMKKAEIISLLMRCRKELEVISADNLAKDRTINRLAGKNSLLLESTRAARGAVREVRAAAKVVESNARASLKEIESEMLDAQVDARNASILIKEKEVEWDNMMRESVDKAREEEKDRKARAIAVEKKKADQERNKLLNDFKQTLKKKDSQIKLLSDVATESRALNVKLHQEKLDVAKIAKQQIDQKSISHNQDLYAVKKRNADVVMQKNKLINKLKSDVKDYEEMAFETAHEHDIAVKTSAKVTRDSDKKIAALCDTANKRLVNYKATKATADSLKDSLDATKEMMSADLADARAQIKQLREELYRKTEEVEELMLMTDLAREDIAKLSPHKVRKTGNPRTWDHTITQLVVEMLAHRTPPSCVAANILSAAKLLMPNAQVVEELPSLRFVRYCRSVLLHVTKTLAAFEIASAQLFQQLFTDGTSRRQTEMQNLVIGILTEAGYRRVVLDGCIISEEHTAESVTASIVVAFRDSGKLLENWRSVTAELYPHRPDLLEQIPRAGQLTLSKLAKDGFEMTDTCNTAQKIQRLVAEAVKQIAKDEGLPPETIKVRESSCWQHLRNIWFGGASDALNVCMHNLLDESLAGLPSIYRIDLDIEDFYRCNEKKFGKTANYAKGDGSGFHHYMGKYHPGAYLFPIARACGGTRQDLCVEGAPAILMNLPYYLQYLYWRMGTCGSSGDGILSTKLYLMMRSVEVVALLRVLSILHISICLPTRWLAGKSQDLADYDFGYYDMGLALDIMESAFEAIIDKPELILDEDFMMGIFKRISDKVDPFQAYLTYMFEDKLSPNISGSSSLDDKVLPFDLIRAAVFYPDRDDIIQTNALCLVIAVDAARAFLLQFRDTTKVTSKYLSSIGGKYSLAVISESDRKAGLGKEASNSISESCHAAATQALKTCGTIRLDHAAGEGQARSNKHFERNHEHYVKSNKKSNSEEECKVGLFLSLCPELQESIIIAAKKGASGLRKYHDDALQLQKDADLRRKQIEHKKKCDNAKEEYIEAWNYIDMYNSERCWKDEAQALSEYNQLKSESESACLKAVKEQISIRDKGFGWVRARHAWSKNGRAYTSQELLKHFIETVLPLEKELEVPTEPPMKLNIEPDTQTLGTTSNLVIAHPDINPMSLENLKNEAMKERMRREDVGELDRDAHRQTYLMPVIDDNLKGFKIEYCFTYTGHDGTPYDAWCDGIVIDVINAKTRMVLIEWNKNKVHSKDQLKSRHKLAIRSWNPKNPKAGAWREYFGDPNE